MIGRLSPESIFHDKFLKALTKKTRALKSLGGAPFSKEQVEELVLKATHPATRRYLVHRRLADYAKEYVTELWKTTPKILRGQKRGGGEREEGENQEDKMPSDGDDVSVAERVLLETDIERRHREKRVRKIVKETPLASKLDGDEDDDIESLVALYDGYRGADEGESSSQGEDEADYAMADASQNID